MPVILPPPIPPIIFTPHLIHAVSGGGGGEDNVKFIFNTMIATGVIGAGAFMYIHFKYRNPFKKIYKESRDLQLYARYLYEFQRMHTRAFISYDILNLDKDVYFMYQKHNPKYYTSSKKEFYRELIKKDPEELIPEKEFKKLFDITEYLYNDMSSKGKLYGATPEDYHKAKAYFLVAKKFDNDFGRPRRGYERILERLQSYIEYKRDTSSRH
jgi:hypothetical protein